MFRDAKRFLSMVSLSMVLAAAMTAAANAQVVDHSAGFTGQTDLTLNGTQNGAANPVTVVAGNLRVTDALGTEAKSAYRTLAIPVNKFRTTFNFHLLVGSTGGGTGLADGLGFCLQGTAATALGGAGGGMGYDGVAKSVIIKFDNYGGGGVYSATGMYLDGATVTNTANDVNLLTAPAIDFQGGHDFNCVMDYDGVTLTVTLKDLSNNNTQTQTYAVDVATHVGAATGFVGFCGGTGGLNAIQEVMNWTYVTAPTGLTATNGVNQVGLSWTAVTGAASYTILRSNTSGSGYAPLPGGTTTGTTFTDSSAVGPNTYYYVVQAVVAGFSGPNSNQATGNPITQISVSPTGPIATSENGVNATLTLTINNSPTANGTITITSSLPSQAIVSGQGNGDASLQGPAGSIMININAGTPSGTTFPITVYGVRDFIANGNQNYTISFVVGGGGPAWTGAAIPTVNGTNMGVDVASLLVSPLGGLLTTTAGGQAAFAVQLNSKPGSGSVTVTIASSDPTEGTVSPTTMTFDALTWNVSQAVNVTGQGFNVTYQNAPYSVSVTVDPGSDAAYLGMSSTVSVLNVHLEVPPALPHVWGGSSGGGGGGCGLLGLEIGLVLGLAALRRRRR